MPVVSVFGRGDTEVEVKISASDFTNIEKFTDFTCKFDVTGEEIFPLRIVRMNQEANSSQLYVVRLAFTQASLLIENPHEPQPAPYLGPRSH